MKVLGKLSKWTHTHTLLTVGGLAVISYIVYQKFIKTKTHGGSTSSFTGADNSHLNTAAKKVVVDINRPQTPTPAPTPTPGTVVIDVNRP